MNFVSNSRSGMNVSYNLSKISQSITQVQKRPTSVNIFIYLTCAKVEVYDIVNFSFITINQNVLTKNRI